MDIIDVLIVFLIAFGLGGLLGCSAILRTVRKGRVVTKGRVYICKDSGPA